MSACEPDPDDTNEGTASTPASASEAEGELQEDDESFWPVSPVLIILSIVFATIIGLSVPVTIYEGIYLLLMDLSPGDRPSSELYFSYTPYTNLVSFGIIVLGLIWFVSWMLWALRKPTTELGDVLAVASWAFTAYVLLWAAIVLIAYWVLEPII